MLRIILGQGASALRVPVHASGMPIVHGRNISFRMSSSSSSRVVSSLSTSPLSLVSKSNQHGIFVATTPSSWLQAHAASFQMNHRQSTSMTKRFFSAAAAGGGGGDAKSSANKSGGEQEQQKKKPKEEGAEAEAEEEVYDANEPMVARVSRSECTVFDMYRVGMWRIQFVDLHLHFFGCLLARRCVFFYF